jgi:hypothetical protein
LVPKIRTADDIAQIGDGLLLLDDSHDNRTLLKYVLLQGVNRKEAGCHLGEESFQLGPVQHRGQSGHGYQVELGPVQVVQDKHKVV